MDNRHSYKNVCNQKICSSFDTPILDCRKRNLLCAWSKCLCKLGALVTNHGYRFINIAIGNISSISGAGR